MFEHRQSSITRINSKIRFEVSPRWCTNFFKDLAYVAKFL